MSMNNKNERGFTLIELMITVAILGILSAIAIPSYSSYVIKSQRTDAKVALLKYAQMQESYYVQKLSYAESLDDTAANGGMGLPSSLQSEEGKYDISLATTPADCTGLATKPCTGFTLTAIPSSGSTQTNDHICAGGFEINNVGRKQAKLAAGTGSFTTTQGALCW